MLWHKDHDLQEVSCVVLPGGFSYGDYLRSGAIARFSPLMKEVRAFARKGGLVLGICNGFQVLLELGLLPGAMLRNKNLRFLCQHVHIRVEDDRTAFTRAGKAGQILRIPIAHFDGNYYAPPRDRSPTSRGSGQVVFRYCDAGGNVTEEANVNGSLHNIAGLVNKEGNVLGHHAPSGAGLRGPPRQRGRASSSSNPSSGVSAPDGPRARASAKKVRHGRPEDPRPAQPDRRGVPANRRAHRARAEPDRARHLLGHVVRALRLQELQGLPQEAPDRGPSMSSRGPARTPGVIDIGDGQVVVFKIESHNHPSYIEPFQGAATGVGGILRDIFTMGARPIAVLDSLRFGPLSDPKNRAIMEGVVSGIAGYGNSIGVPTVGGEVYFQRMLRRQPPGQRLLPGAGQKGQDLLRQGRGRREPGPLRRGQDRPGRHPRGDHGLGRIRQGNRAQEAERPGRRPLQGKAPGRGLSGGHGQGPHSRHPGHGGGRADLLDDRDGRQERAGHRDRSRPCPPAGSRDDAVRDHAFRIPGAHAPRLH